MTDIQIPADLPYSPPFAVTAAADQADETQPASEHGSSATGCAGSLSECEHNTPQASTRTFYRGDYGRAARLIQRMRHVQGDIYTAKPEAQQDKVSILALSIAQVFDDDSDRFDAAEFIDSTQLPVRPEPGDEPEDLSAQTLYEDGPDPDGFGLPEGSDPVTGIARND